MNGPNSRSLPIVSGHSEKGRYGRRPMTHRSARVLLSLSFVALIWSGVATPLQAKSVVRPAAPAVRKAPPPPQRKLVVPAAAKAAAPVVAQRPWLYENSDVPIDMQWLFGTLPNGLRYAIRNNGVPPGQVSVRLRIDAGSLMEREDELGFAHFMEHLTFRGSKYVPDGESKRIWQRLGVTFGSDSNAQTTPTGTTYALDLPQAVPESLNESLKILAGMMTDPNIVPAAVDAERAVVLAEMREGMGPGTKVADATRELYFAGQPLARRSPIGTPETLAAARAEALQAFHERWYRPENAVISISGDIDRKQAEALIVQNFGAWRGQGAAAPPPDFGAPDPKFPATRVAVEPGACLAAPVEAQVGHDRL